jgi:hypothetical protein
MRSGNTLNKPFGGPTAFSGGNLANYDPVSRDVVPLMNNNEREKNM